MFIVMFMERPRLIEVIFIVPLKAVPPARDSTLICPFIAASPVHSMFAASADRLLVVIVRVHFIWLSSGIMNESLDRSSFVRQVFWTTGFADMAFMAAALEHHPYNYAGFALIGVEKITGIRIPDRLARAVSWTDRMMCSQMADFLLRKVGLQLFQAHSGMVSPADFEHFFRTMGWLSPAFQVTT